MLHLLVNSFAFFLSFKYWEINNDPMLFDEQMKEEGMNLKIRKFELRVKGGPPRGPLRQPPRMNAWSLAVEIPW
jgi:hypothetical protein